MYNVKYMKNEIVADSLKTEDVKEVEKFFNKNNCVINLNNNMATIRSMSKTESFKFYKRRNDRSKYIEVVVE